MKNGFFSLLQAAAKFKAFGINMDLAAEAVLVEWCLAVRKRAREAIGTYRYGWPQLAEATQKDRERQGFDPNKPLLRTGELRDSISAMVQMHGPGHGRGIVGSNSEIAVWQELGTSKIPPRSFLLASAKRSEKDIQRIARKYIRSAWQSAGRDNEILHLLHALKMVLETAKEVFDRTIGKDL